MNSILVPIEKNKIQSAKDLMRLYLEQATDTGKGTYKETAHASMMLERAKGICDVLIGIGLLSVQERQNAVEDINRISDKISTVYREKEAEALAKHMQRRP